MHDHKEMDEMKHVTGAVLYMEESELSLGKEEHFIYVLMQSLMVQQEMMDGKNNIRGKEVMGAGKEDWPDDTIFLNKNFEDWVDIEMQNMNVTIEVGSEQVS